jgi:lipopolysaccharide export LptBFGC system permease protein LptF
VLTLGLYLLRGLCFAFLVALGCLGLALFPPSVLSALSRLGGVGIGVVLKYLPFLALELLPYLVPMAFLLAVVGTFSRMAANGEWVAIQMSRIHPVRTAIPGLLVAAVLSVVAFVTTNRFLPHLRLMQEEYKRSAALHVVRDLLPGRTTIQIGEFSIVGERPSDNRFENVVVRLPSIDGQPSSRVVARAADIAVVHDTLRLAFTDAQITTTDGRLRSEHPVSSIPLDEVVSVKRADAKRPKFMTSPAIRAGIESGEVPAEKARQFQFEVERRNALSACYLVFLVLGIPTGLRLKTESMLGALAVTALYACAYYVISLRVGDLAADTDVVPVWIAAWSGNLLGLGVALVLITRWWRR